jgi:ABC-type phosphate transport system substrate-binding protein
MKKIWWVVIIILCASLFGYEGFTYADEETVSFRVVVNASNPTSTLTKQELSRLFLKKTKLWKESGETVLPVDLVENAVREDFSKEVHGKKVAAVKAYWQKKIFSGRAVPPPEKTSDEDVMQYVAEHAGAIGYVSASAEIDPEKVTIVKITK